MMPWSQWPTVAIRECYFARDLEVLVIESNFALLKIYPGKWWFTYPFSFFVFLKTGPEPECAPQFFFISKGISNIFNNNIEGRSNCKRHFSLDSGLTSSWTLPETPRARSTSPDTVGTNPWATRQRPAKDDLCRPAQEWYRGSHYWWTWSTDEWSHCLEGNCEFSTAVEKVK